MAWLVVGLDGTILQKQQDPMTGEPVEGDADMPIEGSIEAMNQLASEGHRLTVFTSRFSAMPDSEKNRLKEQITNDLASMGFPPMEIWTGTHRPDADLFIDNAAVTFDNDWGLALAQTQYMLEERGLVPGPQPDDGMPMEGADPSQGGQPDENNGMS